MHETENLAAARRYITALSNGAGADEVGQFYAPDVVQEEFPNRLVPGGATRDLGALLDAAARGQRVLSAQRYEILNAVERGPAIALEVRWTGVLAVPLGSLPAGGEMRARFAVFIELADGKIRRQRNYDCFEPW